MGIGVKKDFGLGGGKELQEGGSSWVPASRPFLRPLTEEFVPIERK